MKKKFEIKEKGTDFWGRKKYEVTEKTNNGVEALGPLFLAILGLAILTLPSGILAILIYLFTYNLFLRGTEENLQEKKERIAWISTGLSIIFYSIYYFYFFDLNKVGFNVLIILIIFGILCYYALYKIVTWSTLEQEQKTKLKTTYLSYLVVIFAFYMYNLYNDFNTRKCLIDNKWINQDSAKYSFEFKSDGTFRTTYDGGWTSGKWETTFFGDVDMSILGGSNFEKESNYQIDFINSSELRSGSTIYKPINE